jgi:hypothetical protein
MGIEDGAEVQSIGTKNIFKKIIAENSPNLETDLPGTGDF